MAEVSIWMDTELTGVWPAGMTGMGQRSTIQVELTDRLLGMNIRHGARHGLGLRF
jgi:hypothetical protein